MGEYNFSIDCGCGCGRRLLTVTGADLDAWRRVAIENSISNMTCPDCGCEFDLTDEITSVGSESVAKPKITSIDVSSGTIAGGTAVVLTGHALDVGTLTVKFGGVDGVNVRSRSSAHATVDTPAGHVKLNTQGGCRRKVTVSSVSGTFQVSETITGGTSGKTAIVQEVGSGYLYVNSPSGDFTVGETVTGGTSGATATVDATGAIGIEVGEVVTGASSAKTATIVSLGAGYLVVSSPSGAFTSGEWIEGGTGHAKLQLSSDPMSLDVDVEVTNENGQRATGGKLTEAFSYTV